MPLNSFSFIIFLFIVFLAYYLVPKHYQWLVLLVSSFIFYWVASGGLILYLIFSMLVTYFIGILLERINQNRENFSDKNKNSLKNGFSINKKKKNFFLALGLLIIFSILAYFKYYNFFAAEVNSLFSGRILQLHLPEFNLIIPLGISFYTFQSAGYLIDIYRNKIKADKNLLKFFLFISFFPQIIQGPIGRYDSLANQLFDPHNLNYHRIKFAIQLIAWGFIKKIVIADRTKIIVDFIFDNYKEHNGLLIFLGVALYSLQIYCDFSGGIDIVRGVAQVFGINLAENFRRPFFATSVEDFWRRWHITLGSWMRDYVFYPISLSRAFTKLGRFTRSTLGNTLGKYVPSIIASLIAFTFVGVWHGPDWKFVAYGLYNGILISLGIIFTPLTNKYFRRSSVSQDNKRSWRIPKMAGTFFLTTIGRYFSRAENLWMAINMMGWTIFHVNPWVFFDGTVLNLGLEPADFFLLIFLIQILLIVEALQEKGVKIREYISRQSFVFRWSIYLIAIFAVIIFGVYGVGYKSSSFIYQGF